MKLILTSPLRIKTLAGQTLELLPVPMANGFPSGTVAPWSNLWCEFLKLGGRRLQCDGADINRVQDYMRTHGTEALSEDGESAYTVAGNALVECCPAVCGKVSEDPSLSKACVEHTRENSSPEYRSEGTGRAN